MYVFIYSVEKKLIFSNLFYFKPNLIKYKINHFFVDVENDRFCDFGDEINPSNTQSASKMVKSFSWPKNNVDNSNSLIFSLTVAPRTYKLKLK